MRVRTSIQGLVDMLVELVGIKSGIAITQEYLSRTLDGAYSRIEQDLSEPIPRWWNEDPSTVVRMRAEKIEADFITLMNSIGAIPDLASPTDLVIQWARGQNPESFKNAEEFMASMQEVQELLFAIVLNEPIPSEAEDLAKEVRRRYILDHSFPEQRTWNGIIPLQDLFGSEDIPLNTETGSHFDQRFIDFLAAQPDALTGIHWRQFEYLCGEYFRRNGYEVEITPPRGDGGIDVYARKEHGGIGPELIVVQAKRLSGSNTVEITDVKALWTDATDVGATRAIVATTTKLEAGARAFCEARKYRINPAESEDVRRWISEMSTAHG